MTDSMKIYDEIAGKRNLYLKIKDSFPKELLNRTDTDFAINFTHHSTAIEGNTLSLMETKLLLEDQISVGGKDLREIYEIVNHQRTFEFVKNNVRAGNSLDETILKDIHEMLMDRIFQGGIYRDYPVKITGASFSPPVNQEMYSAMQNFYADFSWRKQSMHPVYYAAWTHAEFVRIHPFPDGNGRTSRMIMNYQLMEAGFLPVSIQKQDRLRYYQALDQYAVHNDLDSFSSFIVTLENKELTERLEVAKSLHLISDLDIKMAIADVKKDKTIALSIDEKERER